MEIEQLLCDFSKSIGTKSDTLDKKIKKSCRAIDSGIDDGNCLFGVIILAISRELSQKQDTAKNDVIPIMTPLLRNYIYEHIREAWFQNSIFTGTPWHELVYFTHNLGTTSEEREEYGDWGDDPIDRLNHFMTEYDTFYGSVPELLAFSEIMLLNYDIRVCFRIFKHDAKEYFLRCDAIVPDSLNNPNIVINLKNIGKPDSSNSHYKLCP